MNYYRTKDKDTKIKSGLYTSAGCLSHCNDMKTDRQARQVTPLLIDCRVRKAAHTMIYYRVFFILFIGITMLPIQAWTQISEDKLKAVFLERFTRFINWPDISDMQDTSEPFVIGVINGSAFEAELENLYSNRRIKSKKVRILSVKNLSEISSCHLVYIYGKNEEKLSTLVNIAQQNSVLTIGESPEDLDQGLVICFHVDDRKLRFKINGSAAQKSGLKIDYRLFGMEK